MVDPHDKDIYKRPYNRPNEAWVCGLTTEGRTCPHGPSPRGRCTAQHECAPAKIGERWVCTRPEQYGGACDSQALEDPDFGPIVRDGVGVCCRKVHCSPRRSIRSLRGRTSIIFSMVIVGLVLTALGSGWRNEFLSPGPLTVNHQGASMASLEAMEHGIFSGGASDGESCHVCHTSLKGGLEGLLKSSFQTEKPVSQSSQCLACHGDDVGENAMFAHALPGDILATHTAEAQAEDFSASRSLSLALASFSPGVQTSDDGRLACAACHREHNGALFDLKSMGNQKCQTCHVKQFKSITRGHPEFSTYDSSAGYDYPYRRRTRIVFDHERHETNYFQKDENKAHAPGSCTACHVIEGDSSSTRLKPFEQMCAACHTSNIVSARDEWIHVFGYPSLESDVYEILEDELELPEVPRTAGKPLMSPFMMLLLAGDDMESPEAQEAFDADLAKVLEFEGDLSGIAYDDDPEIVGRLYSAMSALGRQAMDDSSGGFRQLVLEKLSQVRGDGVSPGELDVMFGFPGEGKTVERVIEDIGRKDIIETSGWHVEESGFRIDRASWMSLIDGVENYRALKAATADGGAGPYGELLALFESYNDFRAWFDKTITVNGEDWLFADSGEEVKNKSWKALIVAMVGEADGGDDDAAAEEEEKAEEDSKESEETEAAPDSENDGGAVGDELQAAGDEFVSWMGSKSKFQRWLDENTNYSSEYWTLRAPRSLYYPPIQHADPFTVAWLDFAASLYGENPAAAWVFDELSGRKAGSGIGACMKCHSIDAEKGRHGNGVVKVNWTSRRPERDFTKFKHTPHLKLMNCAECHHAPWVPAIGERLAVAKAASAEEETPAAEVDGDAAPEAAPAEGGEGGDAAEAATTEGGDETEAAVVAAAPVAEPDAAGGSDAASAEERITYLDSFKANDEGLELGVNYMNAGDQSGAHAFASNFEPVGKSDCARCHAKGKAGDSCLICHNYHIEPQNRALGISSLRDLIGQVSSAVAPGESQ